MKQFEVPSYVIAGDGEPFSFTVQVLEPSFLRHPLHYQQVWLEEVRGCSMLQEVLDDFDQLYQTANEKGINFAALCEQELDARKAITAQENNVVFVEFNGSKKQKNKEGSLSKELPDFLPFFNLCTVAYDQLADVSRFLSRRILLLENFGNTHIYQHAVQFLATILETVVHIQTSLESPQEAIVRIESFLIADEEGYNLAVVADTLGYALSFSALSCIDFTLRSNLDNMHFFQEIVADSILQWCENSDIIKDLIILKEFGIQQNDLETFKKTLKAAFS